MPRGQYDRTAHRKPKADVERLAAEAPERTEGYLRDAIAADPALKAAIHEPHPEVAEIARLLVESAPPQPFVPTRESFDAWLDADAPVMPANDRVSQMVGEWASLFCAGWHSATWLPVNDGQDIAVTLTTEHGVSEMAEPAGQWREADIAEALAAMRVKLRV